MGKKFKVKYIGASDNQVAWGNCDDPRKVLELDNIYTLIKTEVNTYHTKYILEGIEGRFNSVSFEFVD